MDLTLSLETTVFRESRETPSDLEADLSQTVSEDSRELGSAASHGPALRTVAPRDVPCV